MAKMAVAVVDERQKDPAGMMMADIVNSWSSLSIQGAESLFGSDWWVTAKNFVKLDNKLITCCCCSSNFPRLILKQVAIIITLY